VPAPPAALGADLAGTGSRWPADAVRSRLIALSRSACVSGRRAAKQNINRDNSPEEHGIIRRGRAPLADFGHVPLGVIAEELH
jgi:hypothetical protein